MFDVDGFEISHDGLGIGAGHIKSRHRPAGGLPARETDVVKSLISSASLPGGKPASRGAVFAHPCTGRAGS
jgi:hypothetical protein